MTTKIELSTIFTLLGTIAVYFLGGFDVVLKTTVMFIGLDYITGLSKGLITHTASSKRGYKGILKKGMYMAIIFVGVGLDRVTNLSETGVSFRSIMLLYIIGTEGISILENLEAMGIKMPTKIKSVLKKLKDEEEPKK